MLAMRGGAASRLILTDEDRAGLERIAGSPSLPFRAVRQARGLLLAGEGVSNEEIGRQVGVSANTVRAWRKALPARGVGQVGVVAPGRGRDSWLPEGAAKRVIGLTLNARPDDGSTHWTTRTLAAKVGISKDSVRRIWAGLGVKPWQTDTFKVSNDPEFETKLVDVVGVYLDPPERAVVFLFRREDTGAGVGPDPGVAADAAGPGRHHDP